MKKIIILCLITFFSNAHARDDGMGGEYTYKINSVSGSYVDMVVIHNNGPTRESGFERLLVDCSTKRTINYGVPSGPVIKQTVVTVKPLGTIIYSGPNGTGAITFAWTQQKLQELVKSSGGYAGRNGDHIWKDDGTPEVLAVCK